MVCTFVRKQSLEIGFTTTSLVYGAKSFFFFGDAHPDHSTDLLAISVIVHLVVWSNGNKIPIPGLLRTIAQDATLYFLIMLTSHLALVLTISLARVRTFS